MAVAPILISTRIRCGSLKEMCDDVRTFDTFVSSTGMSCEIQLFVSLHEIYDKEDVSEQLSSTDFGHPCLVKLADSRFDKLIPFLLSCSGPEQRTMVFDIESGIIHEVKQTDNLDLCLDNYMNEMSPNKSILDFINFVGC